MGRTFVGECGHHVSLNTWLVPSSSSSGKDDRCLMLALKETTITYSCIYSMEINVGNWRPSCISQGSPTTGINELRDRSPLRKWFQSPASWSQETVTALLPLQVPLLSSHTVDSPTASLSFRLAFASQLKSLPTCFLIIQIPHNPTTKIRSHFLHENLLFTSLLSKFL